MGICYVVCAAEYCRPFTPRGEDFVIAADGGVLHLQRLGIAPDLIVGDFDSLDEAPISDKVMTFPVEKDDTDAMLALKEGWRRGYRDFRILAGTGGRTDHTLANLQAIHWLASQGGRGVLCGKEECFTVLCNSTLHFREDVQGVLSVFAVGGRAKGVCIEGGKYLLKDGELCPEFPLGVSNRFIGQKVVVSVKDGALLLVWRGAPEDIKDEKGDRGHD